MHIDRICLEIQENAMRFWLTLFLVVMQLNAIALPVSAQALSSAALPSQASGTDKERMNKFVSDLMRKMTLEEKIGQMNLPSIGFDVTGPVVSEGVHEKIQKGLVGGVFNTYTPNAVRKLQD